MSLLRAAWNFARIRAGPRRRLDDHDAIGAAALSSAHAHRSRGKLRQIMYALELERHYSKAQILEAYLNLAPYGRNIEGVGAASEIYFWQDRRAHRADRKRSR